VRADTMASRRGQGGFFLIEAMVAILIFALGILGLVAMGGTAVSSQSDAQYRTDASSLADAIASQIALGVNRGPPGSAPQVVSASIAASLPAFAHNPGGVNCAFAGAPTADPAVSALILRALNTLPGAAASYQQIIVDPAGSFNRVEITLCWKTASDNVPRRHTVVTYVN
jgi:type IV pilus assembly protein PilV